MPIPAWKLQQCLFSSPFHKHGEKFRAQFSAKGQKVYRDLRDPIKVCRERSPLRAEKKIERNRAAPGEPPILATPNGRAVPRHRTIRLAISPCLRKCLPD